ncbi:MAG: esterase-like activity of phytase family protein [Gammaproteobacteria bacterium]|nr:esterase-like activity of phytase family protein [Gammaproteobacteria bacterium]
MRRSTSILTVLAISIGLLWATNGVAKTPRLIENGRFTIDPVNINDIHISELSGLAWDEDEKLLYAVSDKGRIFHFRLKLKGNDVMAIEPVYASPLGGNEEKAAKHRLDAEGLAVLNANNGKSNDTELVVVVEGATPRIIRFNPAGTMLGEIPAPPPLDEPDNYRGSNKALESVTYDAKYGLITAPELPLANRPKDTHTVYARDRHWSFAAHPVKDSRLKALEMLPDGNLLVLERSFTGSTKPLVVSLRYVNLAGCPVDGACNVEDLAVFSEGLDNFEGLTHIGNNRFLIVSDHGKKDHRNTTFMLFTLQY